MTRDRYYIEELPCNTIWAVVDGRTERVCSDHDRSIEARLEAARRNAELPSSGSADETVLNGPADVRHDHPSSVSRTELDRRVGRGGGRFYLFCDVDPQTSQIVIETSWLPDLPELRRELGANGFHRRSDGSYRATLPDAEDHVGILRRATKVLASLLREATS